jgi:hypothetical protein
VAEIGVERGDEGIPARKNGLLEFRKVAAALCQRRRAIAQEGTALTLKRAVQGPICPTKLSSVRVHWKRPLAASVT